MLLKLLKIAFHNPDFLSDTVIGTSRGWRLLLSEELNTVPAYPKNDETLEIWDGKDWDILCDFHHHFNRTYRTKRSV